MGEFNEIGSSFLLNLLVFVFLLVLYLVDIEIASRLIQMWNSLLTSYSLNYWEKDLLLIQCDIVWVVIPWVCIVQVQWPNGSLVVEWSIFLVFNDSTMHFLANFCSIFCEESSHKYVKMDCRIVPLSWCGWLTSLWY